jgi:hypothetical protein
MKKTEKLGKLKKKSNFEKKIKKKQKKKKKWRRITVIHNEIYVRK